MGVDTGTPYSQTLLEELLTSRTGGQFACRSDTSAGQRLSRSEGTVI